MANMSAIPLRIGGQLRDSGEPDTIVGHGRSAPNRLRRLT